MNLKFRRTNQKELEELSEKKVTDCGHPCFTSRRKFANICRISFTDFVNEAVKQNLSVSTGKRMLKKVGKALFVKHGGRITGNFPMSAEG